MIALDQFSQKSGLRGLLGSPIAIVSALDSMR